MADESFAAAQAAVLHRYGLTATERWVDSAVVGGQAHVLELGVGPPVVMLNGIGVPAAMMAPLIAHLHGYTVYAVDLPGFGLTDANPAFADDVRANAVRFIADVLDGLGLDSPAIVANSLGSLWATWFALDHPDRVSALAHIGCPAVVLDTSASVPMRLLSVRWLGPLMMRIQRPSPRQVAGLAKMVHEHPLPPEIASLILATERLDHFEGMFLGLLRRLVRLRGNRSERALTASQLARVTAPTLLVFGADDPMGGPHVGQRMVDSMSDAELHVVRGGHAPWLHHADEIAPPLTMFLRRIDERAI
ncbi:MAG: alpha/beta hydrolase [Acidimicrobiales bacterium]|nr:alpha/beta hydrolase [Acidimicrobiales bacterium]